MCVCYSIRNAERGVAPEEASLCVSSFSHETGTGATDGSEYYTTAAVGYSGPNRLIPMPVESATDSRRVSQHLGPDIITNGLR